MMDEIGPYSANASRRLGIKQLALRLDMGLANQNSAIGVWR